MITTEKGSALYCKFASGEKLTDDEMLDLVDFGKDLLARSNGGAAIDADGNVRIKMTEAVARARYAYEMALMEMRGEPSTCSYGDWLWLNDKSIIIVDNV